jgi:nitrite reductase (NO-forming)
MRRGTASATAQALARAWVIAAAASLLLPPRDRLGWWLPIHLALAGGAATAIAGAVPDFAAALCSARRRPWAWAPIALFSAGAAAIAVGIPTGGDTLIAFGGTAFAAGAVTLAAAVWATWRHAINRRHAPIVALYGFAALCPLAGAAIGALLGTGAIHSAGAYLDLRRAHIALNLLGFLGLTIVATSTLLVPTVLRVRAPAWHTGAAFLACASGVVIGSVGLALGERAIAGAGALAYTVGAAVAVDGAWRALRRRPSRPERAAAAHLILALAWLVAGGLASTIGVILVSDRLLTMMVVMVTLGTVVQSLVGAWSHLTPMAAPGGPEVHRLLLARADVGAWPQVVAFNLGVALVAAAALGAPSVAAGIALVLGAALFAITKGRVVRLPEPPDAP